MKKIFLSLTALFFNLVLFSQSFVALNSTTSNALNSIHFLDENIGYSVSVGGTILKTINGGTNWTTQVSNTTVDLTDVICLGATNAITVGRSGRILKTTNGGANWTQISSGTFTDLMRIGKAGGSLIITGYNGLILKSDNNGLSWYNISSGSFSHLYGSWFINNNTGFIVGQDGVILKTTNGGTTWDTVFSGTSFQLLDISFSDNNTGFIVGGDGSLNQSIILKTSNGGDNWNPIILSGNLLTQNFFSTVNFLNTQTGYIIGGSVTNNTSTILKTNDGGISWNEQPTNFARQFGGSFPSFNAGYTCGLNGSILKIRNINLGFNEATKQVEVKTFPNPTSNLFTISYEEGALPTNSVIKVIDQNGAIVLQQTDGIIDISNCSNGTYFIDISNELFSTRIKIVKQ